jgi:hypothetical protein
MSTAKPRNYARVFETFGVGFSVTGSDGALAGACPWCGKDEFRLNTTTGWYRCEHCGEGRGDVTRYLSWVHAGYLARTLPGHYRALRARRSLATQRLRAHQLAYAEGLGCWLVPFKDASGNVVNILRYYPDGREPNELMLPGLPAAIFGLDRLAGADRRLPVLVCDGPFDAIALDHSVGAGNRGRYVIVATPGAFEGEWAGRFRGRKVRVFYGNDEGGRDRTARVQKLLGEDGVAEELLALRWPAETPDGYGVNDLVRDHPNRSVLGWLVDRCYKVVRRPRLAWEHGWERAPGTRPPDDWVWPDRLPCGTYVSFSGKRGTLKSTLMRELVARYTRGEPLPGCDKVGLPPGHVVYVTAEDDPRAVWASLELAKAGTDLVTVVPAVLKDGDPLNMLDHLEEIRLMVRQLGARLVVVDGQNSVVGAPNISTDMLARHNITNRLHQFAQREGVCLVGIRNEDPEGRAYGPASLSDMGRAIIRSLEEEPAGGDRYFRLVFERISDRAPSTHPPIPYSVEDLGGSSRRIVWGKSPPGPTPKRLKAAAKAAGTGAGGEP